MGVKDARELPFTAETQSSQRKGQGFEVLCVLRVSAVRI